MTDITPELAQRMEAFVRKVAAYADEFKDTTERNSNFLLADGTTYAAKEARAIVAELPEPVDVDLVEAREFLIQSKGPYLVGDFATFARDGAYDDDEDAKAILAAIKRGRALEREGR